MGFTAHCEKDFIYEFYSLSYLFFCNEVLFFCALVCFVLDVSYHTQSYNCHPLRFQLGLKVSENPAIINAE